MVTEKWMNDLIHWHLHREYVSEFKIIDNLNQHPDGITFEEWMDRQGPAITGIIEAKNVPLSLWMKLDVAPASEYSDAMAELEEMRDTHQEQIDKASVAVLEAENSLKKAADGMVKSASISVQMGMRLEVAMDEIERLRGFLQTIADTRLFIGDFAKWVRELATTALSEPVELKEIKVEDEEPNDCGNCPFHKICPEANDRPIL